MNAVSVDEDLLAQVTSAFSRHDLDAIVSLFAEDGQFVNARGASALGDRYSGRREVRDYFARLFANCPDLAYRPLSKIGSAAIRPSCSGTAQQRRKPVRYRTGTAATC